MDSRTLTLIRANLKHLRTAFAECAVRWPGLRLVVTNSDMPPANGLLQWTVAAGKMESAWLYGDTEEEGDERVKVTDLATGVFWGLAAEAGHVVRGLLPSGLAVEPAGLWVGKMVSASLAGREGSRLRGWINEGVTTESGFVGASARACAVSANGWTFLSPLGPFEASVILIDEITLRLAETEGDVNSHNKPTVHTSRGRPPDLFTHRRAEHARKHVANAGLSWKEAVELYRAENPEDRGVTVDKYRRAYERTSSAEIPRRKPT